MTQAMVFAWGDPNDSRLGGVDVRRHHLPQPVKLLSDVMKRLRLTIASASPPNTHSIIACGVAHTILLTATGQLLTWGCGKYGQLGYGNLWDREEPVVVPSLRSVTSFAAGDRHCIAVQSSKYVLDLTEKTYAWGFNCYGELGLGMDVVHHPLRVTPSGDKSIRLQPAVVCVFNEHVEHCSAGARHSLVVSRDLPSDINPKASRFDCKRSGDSESGSNDLRYCLDTRPSSAGAVRFSYESVVKCRSCRQSLVCRSCARRCHRNHNLEVGFVRWVPKRDKCGCVQSGECRAAWSRERAIFDGLIDQTTMYQKSTKEESLSMQHFREALATIHPEGLSEDDIDSGEVALHSRAGRVTWPVFERWHRSHFEGAY